MIDDTELNTSPLLIDGEEYVYCREFPPEWNLLAAVIYRARMDARGYRLGTDTKTGNNHYQRLAREWFRKRSPEIHGWGWFIEQLAIPKHIELRILQSAFADKPVRITG